MQSVNGFQGQVSVSLTGLPSQVTPSVAFPVFISAGGSQNVLFTVANAVARGNYSLTFAGTSGSLTGNASLTLTVSGVSVAGPTQDFKKQVIYQIVTDRFFDGDLSNDNPPQSPGMYDSTKTNWQMYWGGDLAGIQQNMAYLAGMGVTAIWISPPVQNINTLAVLSGTSYAPYHGYWARDMQQISEHFGDVNNTWTAFDNLIAAAHQNGIRVIVDFAGNDSNPDDGGEYGALYNNDGTVFANYQNDPAPPNNLFHHNPTITNYNDPFQLQYYTLDDLADLNQENSQVDAYLKQSLVQFVQHGTDAFRLDATKDVTWGWEYSLANTAYTTGPTFVFGEWYQAITDPTYPDSVTFSNRSGIAPLDYPLAFALQDAFGNDADFHEVDDTITQENGQFTSPNDLVTFLDNHDIPRLLSVNNNQNRLNEALALLLTCRGIPVVLYGDEQYLHNDTNGGGDPYNRLWMSSFNTGTTAYQVVTQMANLRQSNPALAYGTSLQRWINSDVYILERQFFNDIVLIAVNKNDTSNSPSITGLYTALPPGNYSDYLNGLLGGLSITVNSGGGNNPVTPFTLPPHSVSVWETSSPAAAPELGSVGPRVMQAGLTATAGGDGFGSSLGTVLVGTTPAAVQSWSNSSVVFTVPAVTPGPYNLTITPSGGTVSNALPLTVLSGPQVPVTFTVNNVTLQSGASVYLTGNVFELGSNAQNTATAVGPLLAVQDTSTTSFFIDASVPAGATIQFSFFQALSDGTVVASDSGSPQSYTVPTTGVGSVSVNW